MTMARMERANTGWQTRKIWLTSSNTQFEGTKIVGLPFVLIGSENVQYASAWDTLKYSISDAFIQTM